MDNQNINNLIMEDENIVSDIAESDGITKKKITVPKELQESMLKFFLKTSIPRKARQERERLNNTLSENEGQEMK